MIILFNTSRISPFHHYHLHFRHYYQAKSTCIKIIKEHKMKILQTHKSEELHHDTKKTPMYVVHLILGLRPQNLSHQVTFIKIKVTIRNTLLPSFLLNFIRTLLGITFKELNPTQIPYKHHISASLSSFDICRTIHHRHLLYIYIYMCDNT